VVPLWGELIPLRDDAQVPTGGCFGKASRAVL
jgi:hypothetical protein